MWFNNKKPKTVNIAVTETKFKLCDLKDMVTDFTLRREKVVSGSYFFHPVTHEFEHGCLCYYEGDTYVMLPVSNYKYIHIDECFSEYQKEQPVVS